jgi:hypothetical protein
MLLAPSTRMVERLRNGRDCFPGNNGPTQFPVIANPVRTLRARRFNRANIEALRRTLNQIE